MLYEIAIFSHFFLLIDVFCKNNPLLFYAILFAHRALGRSIRERVRILGDILLRIYLYSLI